MRRRDGGRRQQRRQRDGTDLHELADVHLLLPLLDPVRSGGCGCRCRRNRNSCAAATEHDDLAGQVDAPGRTWPFWPYGGRGVDPPARKSGFSDRVLDEGDSIVADRALGTEDVAQLRLQLLQGRHVLRERCECREAEPRAHIGSAGEDRGVLGCTCACCEPPHVSAAELAARPRCCTVREGVARGDHRVALALQRGFAVTDDLKGVVRRLASQHHPRRRGENRADDDSGDRDLTPPAPATQVVDAAVEDGRKLRLVVRTELLASDRVQPAEQLEGSGRLIASRPPRASARTPPRVGGAPGEVERGSCPGGRRAPSRSLPVRDPCQIDSVSRSCSSGVRLARARRSGANSAGSGPCA